MPLLLFNKPYGVICQFSGDGARPTLAKFIRVPEVYPAGRLDTDSEGLLLLTDDGILQARISDPRNKLPKHYWVQVEGVPDRAALEALARGVDLGDFVTRPAQVRLVDEPPDLWPRNPPIRYRAAIPTSWIELVITEGKNRQVRRMTAHVGFPTLRLIRHRIGPYSIQGLAPGEWIEGQAREVPRNAQQPREERKPASARKHTSAPTHKPAPASPRKPALAAPRRAASTAPRKAASAALRKPGPTTPRKPAPASPRKSASASPRKSASPIRAPTTRRAKP